MWILYAFGSAFFAGITAILVLKNKLIVENGNLYWRHIMRKEVKIALVVLELYY